MKFQLSLFLGLASSLAFAQQGGIGAVKVEPNPAKAGQEVKITISAEGEAPSLCGMVVHFDDGSESRQIKIDGKDGKFPATIAKTYAKAGSLPGGLQDERQGWQDRRLRLQGWQGRHAASPTTGLR